MHSTRFKHYLHYKLLNSLFLGCSLGTIFVIYAPIPPKVYSIGGIALSLGAWILTLFYAQILKQSSYKIVLLGLEVIPFFYLLAYLFFPNSLFGALIIYTLYQITFIFGDYTNRAETLIFSHKPLLSALDSRKQIGYLLGLGVAFVFYMILEYNGITKKEAQVYCMHFLLLLLQCVIFITLLCAFRKSRAKE